MHICPSYTNETSKTSALKKKKYYNNFEHISPLNHNGFIGWSGPLVDLKYLGLWHFYQNWNYFLQFHMLNSAGQSQSQRCVSEISMRFISLKWDSEY